MGIAVHRNVLKHVEEEREISGRVMTLKLKTAGGSMAFIPKASFFRSMAGGVPSGATEGSSMGPGWDYFFLPFRALFRDPFSEHFFVIFGT